ncbi:MAG: hypothetical protein K6E35_07865 [Bacteroidales bacterium]|nr:hypothetical protein [Bacteroidales bacterium]
MATIEYSPALKADGVVLDQRDCKAVEPIIRKAADKERALAEKYQYIIDGGEATERQTDLQIQHEERAEHLRAILRLLEQFV